MHSDKRTEVEDRTGSIAMVRSLIARAERRPLLTRLAFGKGYVEGLRQHEQGMVLAALLPEAGPAWTRPTALPVGLVNEVRARMAAIKLPELALARGQRAIKLRAKRTEAGFQAVVDAQARLYASASGSNSASLNRTDSMTSNSKISDAT